MGNCFRGNRKESERMQTKKLHPLPETVTSSQDIRKVYKFNPKVIGHGHFGTVRIATLISNPGKKFAIKSILKQKIQKDVHLFQRELSILRQLDHPNIIKFYETYQDPKFFHLVMEYCRGGELFDRIAKLGHFSELQAMKLMKALFLAVNYLHQQGICHRDLKPENLLYSDNTENASIKIIDFGLSRQFDLEKEFSENLKQMNTMVGTALYVAPEVIKGTKYNSSCDNWSLGVILYILLCGYPPFTGVTQMEIFEKISFKKIDFSGKEWKKTSKEVKDLISKLLCDTRYRISIKQALKHRWFSINHIKTKEEQKEIDPNVINLIRNFRGVDKFQKEALRVMVNMLNEHEIKHMREAFIQFDLEQTGKISFTEFQEVMKKLGYKETDKQIGKVLAHLDIDNDQCINYTEFITLILDKKVYSNREKLWSVFKYFDVDNSNEITSGNLKEAMMRYGKNLSEAELEEMIAAHDLTNNKKLNFEEFKEMMLQENKIEKIELPHENLQENDEEDDYDEEEEEEKQYSQGQKESDQ